MSVRERLIAYQNRAESEFKSRKTPRTFLHYAAAFSLFLFSNLVAMVLLPLRMFRPLTKGTVNHGSIATMSSENADALLSRKGLVLLEFGAAWCGPCLMMEPVLRRYAESSDEVLVVSVNADTQSAIAARFDVRGLPQFILLKDGVEVRRHAGPMTIHDLEEFCSL